MTQVSLYREAWIEFKRYFYDLLPLIAGFSALIAFFYYFEIRDIWRLVDQVTPLIQEKVANKNAQPNFEALNSTLDSAGLINPASLLSNIAQSVFVYFLSVAYLKLAPIYPDRKPTLDIADFFLWIWQMIKVWFASMGLTIVLGLVLVAVPAFVIFSFMPHIEPDHNTIALLVSLIGSTLLTCGILMAVCYPMIKFLFVTPLFLSGEDNIPLRASWGLTKGNGWRLFWNYFGLGWTLFLVFFVALLVLLTVFYVMDSISVNSVVFVGTMSLLLSFMNVSAAALTGIFACMACRRMVQKQNAAGLTTVS